MSFWEAQQLAAGKCFVTTEVLADEILNAIKAYPNILDPWLNPGESKHTMKTNANILDPWLNPGESKQEEVNSTEAPFNLWWTEASRRHSAKSNTLDNPKQEARVYSEFVEAWLDSYRSLAATALNLSGVDQVPAFVPPENIPSGYDTLLLPSHLDPYRQMILDRVLGSGSLIPFVCPIRDVNKWQKLREQEGTEVPWDSGSFVTFPTDIPTNGEFETWATNFSTAEEFITGETEFIDTDNASFVSDFSVIEDEEITSTSDVDVAPRRRLQEDEVVELLSSREVPDWPRNLELTAPPFMIRPSITEGLGLVDSFLESTLQGSPKADPIGVTVPHGNSEIAGVFRDARRIFGLHGFGAVFDRRLWVEGRMADRYPPSAEEILLNRHPTREGRVWDSWRSMKLYHVGTKDGFFRSEGGMSALLKDWTGKGWNEYRTTTLLRSYKMIGPSDSPRPDLVRMKIHGALKERSTVELFLKRPFAQLAASKQPQGFVSDSSNSLHALRREIVSSGERSFFKIVQQRSMEPFPREIELPSALKGSLLVRDKLKTCAKRQNEITGRRSSLTDRIRLEEILESNKQTMVSVIVSDGSVCGGETWRIEGIKWPEEFVPVEVTCVRPFLDDLEEVKAIQSPFGSLNEEHLSRHEIDELPGKYLFITKIIDYAASRNVCPGGWMDPTLLQNANRTVDWPLEQHRYTILNASDDYLCDAGTISRPGFSFAGQSNPKIRRCCEAAIGGTPTTDAFSTPEEMSFIPSDALSPNCIFCSIQGGPAQQTNSLTVDVASRIDASCLEPAGELFSSSVSVTGTDVIWGVPSASACRNIFAARRRLMDGSKPNVFVSSDVSSFYLRWFWVLVDGGGGVSTDAVCIGTRNDWMPQEINIDEKSLKLSSEGLGLWEGTSNTRVLEIRSGRFGSPAQFSETGPISAAMPFCYDEKGTQMLDSSRVDWANPVFAPSAGPGQPPSSWLGDSFSGPGDFLPWDAWLRAEADPWESGTVVSVKPSLDMVLGDRETSGSRMINGPFFPERLYKGIRRFHGCPGEVAFPPPEVVNGSPVDLFPYDPRVVRRWDREVSADPETRGKVASGSAWGGFPFSDIVGEQAAVEADSAQVVWHWMISQGKDEESWRTFHEYSRGNPDSPFHDPWMEVRNEGRGAARSRKPFVLRNPLFEAHSVFRDGGRGSALFWGRELRSLRVGNGWPSAVGTSSLDSYKDSSLVDNLKHWLTWLCSGESGVTHRFDIRINKLIEPFLAKVAFHDVTTLEEVFTSVLQSEENQICISFRSSSSRKQDAVSVSGGADDVEVKEAIAAADGRCSFVLNSETYLGEGGIELPETVTSSTGHNLKVINVTRGQSPNGHLDENHKSNAESNYQIRCNKEHEMNILWDSITDLGSILGQWSAAREGILRKSCYEISTHFNLWREETASELIGSDEFTYYDLDWLRSLDPERYLTYLKDGELESRRTTCFLDHVEFLANAVIQVTSEVLRSLIVDLDTATRFDRPADEPLPPLRDSVTGNFLELDDEIFYKYEFWQSLEALASHQNKEVDGKEWDVVVRSRAEGNTIPGHLMWYVQDLRSVFQAKDRSAWKRSRASTMLPPITRVQNPDSGPAEHNLGFSVLTPHDVGSAICPDCNSIWQAVRGLPDDSLSTIMPDGAELGEARADLMIAVETFLTTMSGAMAAQRNTGADGFSQSANLSSGFFCWVADLGYDSDPFSEDVPKAVALTVDNDHDLIRMFLVRNSSIDGWSAGHGEVEKDFKQDEKLGSCAAIGKGHEFSICSKKKEVKVEEDVIYKKFLPILDDVRKTSAVAINSGLKFYKPFKQSSPRDSAARVIDLRASTHDALLAFAAEYLDGLEMDVKSIGILDIPSERIFDVRQNWIGASTNIDLVLKAIEMDGGKKDSESGLSLQTQISQADSAVRRELFWGLSPRALDLLFMTSIDNSERVLFNDLEDEAFDKYLRYQILPTVRESNRNVMVDLEPIATYARYDKSQRGSPSADSGGLPPYLGLYRTAMEYRMNELDILAAAERIIAALPRDLANLVSETVVQEVVGSSLREFAATFALDLLPSKVRHVKPVQTVECGESFDFSCEKEDVEAEWAFGHHIALRSDSGAMRRSHRGGDVRSSMPWQIDARNMDTMSYRRWLGLDQSASGFVECSSCAYGASEELRRHSVLGPTVRSMLVVFKTERSRQIFEGRLFVAGTKSTTIPRPLPSSWKVGDVVSLLPNDSSDLQRLVVLRPLRKISVVRSLSSKHVSQRQELFDIDGIREEIDRWSPPESVADLIEGDVPDFDVGPDDPVHQLMSKCGDLRRGTKQECPLGVVKDRFGICLDGPPPIWGREDICGCLSAFTCLHSECTTQWIQKTELVKPSAAAQQMSDYYSPQWDWTRGCKSVDVGRWDTHNRVFGATVPARDHLKWDKTIFHDGPDLNLGQLRGEGNPVPYWITLKRFDSCVRLLEPWQVNEETTCESLRMNLGLGPEDADGLPLFRRRMAVQGDRRKEQPETIPPSKPLMGQVRSPAKETGPFGSELDFYGLGHVWSAMDWVINAAIGDLTSGNLQDAPLGLPDEYEEAWVTAARRPIVKLTAAIVESGIKAKKSLELEIPGFQIISTIPTFRDLNLNQSTWRGFTSPFQPLTRINWDEMSVEKKTKARNLYFSEGFAEVWDNAEFFKRTESLRRSRALLQETVSEPISDRDLSTDVVSAELATQIVRTVLARGRELTKSELDGVFTELDLHATSRASQLHRLEGYKNVRRIGQSLLMRKVPLNTERNQRIGINTDTWRRERFQGVTQWKQIQTDWLRRRQDIIDDMKST